jgi:predicted site-specific integrase-resolvase
MSIGHLERQVQKGTLKAAQTPEGALLVANEDVLNAKLAQMAVDPTLQGKGIRVTAAAEKYAISHANLSRWADAGLIKILDRRPKFLLLDEGDVKLTVEIFRTAQKHTSSYVKAGHILRRIKGQTET